MAKLSKNIDKDTSEMIDDQKVLEEIKRRKKQFIIIVPIVFIVVLVASFVYFSNRKNSDISKGELFGKNVSKYVKLGDYKNITYTAIDISVSDEEVEEKLNSIIVNKTTFTELPDRMGTEVKNGDVVNCSYKALFDGKELESGSDKFEIGSDSFPEFENALIGHKVGDKLNVNAKIPDDYSGKFDECKGKVVSFEVTINFALKKNIPELTDEFAKNQSYGACEHAKDFKQYLRDSIQAEREKAAREAISEEVMSTIVKNSKFKKYSAAVDNYCETMEQTNKSMAEYYNMEYSEYVNVFYGKTIEELNAETREITEELVKEELVLVEIANREKLNVKKNSDYYKDNLPNYVAKYGCDIEDELFEKISEKELCKEMTYERVVNYLLDNAVAK